MKIPKRKKLSDLVKQAFSDKKKIPEIISTVIFPPAGFVKQSLNLQLDKANKLNQQAETLSKQADIENDINKKNQLYRQSLELSKKASETAKTVRKEAAAVPGIVEAGTQLAGALLPLGKAGKAVSGPVASLISKPLTKPYTEGLEEERTRNIIESYAKKYPQVKVSSNLPLSEQRKAYEDYIKSLSQQKYKLTMPEGYQEPTDPIRQAAEGVKQFWQGSMKPSLTRFAQSWAEKLGMPDLAVNLNKKLQDYEQEYLSREDLASPDWAEEFKKNPLQATGMFIGRMFGNAVGYMGSLAAVPLITRRYNYWTTVAPMQAIETGGFLNDLNEETKDSDLAQTLATLYGAISSMIETSLGYTPAGLAKWLSKPTQLTAQKGFVDAVKSLGKAGLKTLTNAIQEGNEEVLQRGTELIMRNWLKQPPVENIFSDLAMQWIGGTVASLPMGVSNISSQPQVGLTIEEVKPETQPIPKELESLAEEARKYKSYIQFEADKKINYPIEQTKIQDSKKELADHLPKLEKLEKEIEQPYYQFMDLRGKSRPYIKRNLKEAQRVANYLKEEIKNNELLLKYGFKNGKDFYDRAIKGVKPTTEPQPPSTMPLRAQNLPVERGLAQEGIKLPTEAKQPPKLPDNNISKTYHQPTKPSKIGLDIKQFGKEVGVPVRKTAQYTPISTSNEVEKAKQFIQANLNDWKLYLSGEKEIPSEISHSAFIDASRDLLNTNYDKDLITTFANSPLISETSKIAQELSLLAEKDPDSFFAKIKEVKEAREAQAKKITPRNVPDIKKSISNSVKQSVIQKLLEKSPANTPLVKALKSGEITIEQLMSMETPERINVLTKYLGDKAPQANLEFEKKQILKHIETGINNWISKYGFIGRYSPEKMTEMKKSLEEWKQEQFRRVFNPKEYETFLQSLAEKQVGVSITEDEANKLFNLTQGVETLKKNWNPETNQWSSEADRIKYGASKVLLEKYTEGLKKPSTIKDSLIARLNEFKATSQNNVPKAIFDLVKDTIKSISDLSISMVASIDNSFIGRQGIKVLYTKPKVWAKSAYQSMSNFAKTLKDGDNVWDAVLSDYYSRPNYMNGSYKTAKILPRSFERFPTATPEKIPLVGRVFKASEIAFNGSDLMMRSNLYDLMSKIASNNGVDMTDPYQIKSYGTVINSLTGRGQWGRMGDDSVVRWIIWAPNLLKGNIDVLTAHAGQDISPEARKFAANNLLKIIASLAVTLLMARALDDDSVELDSRSSNFGKIMIGPNNDIPVDISGGMMSLVTLASRLVTGETKSSRTGKITSLYNPEYGQPTMWDVLVNFLEGKTTPMTHAVINLLNNQMYGGKQPTFGRMAESLFVPITIQNISEISETEVYQKPAALWAVILDAFGFNSSAPIRQIKYDEPIMQEIKRLQDGGYDTVQTSFISGFLQENPMLSVEDNKIIFGKLTNLSNQKLGGLIKTEQYQNATDEEKAKMISSFMDKNRDFIYEGFIANKIKGLSGQELMDMLSYLKKSGVLNETRFKKLIKNGVIKL